MEQDNIDKLKEAWDKFIDELGKELKLYKLLDWLNKKITNLSIKR